MDLNKSPQQEEEDEDSFSLKLWKATKRQQTEPSFSFKKKQAITNMDGKKTVKYRDEPVMQKLIGDILRESDKFPDESQSKTEPKTEIEQYSPNIFAGTVNLPHVCTEQQKKIYGLQDEGVCMQFEISGHSIIVVAIGRMGYVPLQGVQVQLYVPKTIATYLQIKGSKLTTKKVPQRLKIIDGRAFIFIQRKKQLNSTNILDYPCFVIDPSNLIYPTYLCSWIDCKRRLTLVNYFQEPKQVNQHTVFGNACHKLLEWLASQIITVEEYFQDQDANARKLYDSMLYDMFLVKKAFGDFWNACNGRLKNLAIFYKKHINDHEELTVEPYRKLSLRIDKVVQSEIMLRSSVYGLKGKIDLLLFGVLFDRKNKTETPVYIPMELKSGRRVSDAHKRQTDIYNILVREEYKHDTIGLLYYSDSDIKFFRYEDPLTAYEIVMIHRNPVAEHLTRIF